MDYNEFAQRIKTKYPEYNDMENKDLAQKMVAKYPNEYSDVTFDDTPLPEVQVNEDGSLVQPLQGKVERSIDLTPSGLLNNVSSTIAGAVTAPLSAIKYKESLGDAFRRNRQIGLEEGQKHPVKNAVTDITTYALLPEARALKGAGLGAKIGNSALTGAYQGGLIGGLDSLKDRGDLSGLGVGAGIGGGIGVSIPLAGKGIQASAKPIGKGLKWLTSKFSNLNPKTIEQAIKPNSKALDMSEEQAQNSLMNISERVRNAYKNLLAKRGQAVGDATKKLKAVDTRISAEDLAKDISGTFDQYQGDLVNPARNMTGNLEQDLIDLINSGKIEYNPNLMISKNGIKTIKKPSDFVLQNNPQTIIPDLQLNSPYGQVMDSLNPTGNIFSEYTPALRNNAPLAKNMTTYDKTANLNPDDIVEIYRGVPDGINEINPGDFVTTNYDLANSYSNGNVLSKRVKASEILDDLDEPLGEEYIYRTNRNREVKRTKQNVLQSIFGESKAPLTLTNQNNGKVVNLSASSAKKMINTAYQNLENQIEQLGLQGEAKATVLNDSLDILTNVKDIYQNSIPILQHGDLKGVAGRTMERYAIPVEMNGNRYNVMLTTKNGKVDDIGILYDLKSTKNPLDGNLKPSQKMSSRRQGNTTSINDLTEFVNGNLAKYKPSEEYFNTVSPTDLHKIREQIGKMATWSDETARQYKNPILEQIYGKYSSRLNELSPELQSANQAYAQLRNFQKNEGLRKILRPGDNIDSAASALRNYNSTVTKGNTGRNIQELENVLANEGYGKFLNDIDDINAAMDIQKRMDTGLNFLGMNNLLRGGTALGLRGARALNSNPAIMNLYNSLGQEVPSWLVPLLYGTGTSLTE